MHEGIPGFSQLTADEKRLLVRAATVDPAFVQDTIYAIRGSDPLQIALGRTAEEMQEDADFTVRWGLVAREAEALLNGINAAISIRRHRLGSAALQVYQFARTFARQKEHSNLLSHLAKMKARNKFGKRRPAQAPPVTPETQAAKK